MLSLIRHSCDNEGRTMGFTWYQVAFWTMTLGGLGLFLYGISSLSTVLKRMASTRLSGVINKLSNNPFMGLLVGTGFTAIVL